MKPLFIRMIALGLILTVAMPSLSWAGTRCLAPRHQVPVSELFGEPARADSGVQEAVWKDLGTLSRFFIESLQQRRVEWLTRVFLTRETPSPDKLFVLYDHFLFRPLAWVLKFFHLRAFLFSVSLLSLAACHSTGSLRTPPGNIQAPDLASPANIQDDAIHRSGTRMLPFLNHGKPNVVRFQRQAGGFEVTLNGHAVDPNHLTGVVWQKTDGQTHISAYTRGRMHVMLGKLLPGNHGIPGLDADVVPENRIEELNRSGIHSIRLYYLPSEMADPSGVRQIKLILNYLYEKQGLQVTLGHWAGLWELPGSVDVTDGSPAKKEQLKTQILEWVRTYRNEPWLLAYGIGNENNYHAQDERGTVRFEWRKMNFTQKEYFSFMNALAKIVRDNDPNHPVLLGNGALSDSEATLIRSMKQAGTWHFDAPCINAYPGVFGGKVEDFAALGAKVQSLDLPFAICEIGSPDYPGFPNPAQYLRDLSFHWNQHQPAMGYFFSSHDEAWKGAESGRPEESHFGILNNSETVKALVALKERQRPQSGLPAKTPQQPGKPQGSLFNSHPWNGRFSKPVLSAYHSAA